MSRQTRLKIEIKILPLWVRESTNPSVPRCIEGKATDYMSHRSSMNTEDIRKGWVVRDVLQCVLLCTLMLQHRTESKAWGNISLFGFKVLRGDSLMSREAWQQAGNQSRKLRDHILMAYR